MKTDLYQIVINSNYQNEMIDITSKVENIVLESKVQNGICILFVPHTTAAVTINENADPDVKADILKGLNESFPDLKSYKHFEGNSVAHIKSSLVGVEKTLIIDNGKIVLGTWQGIYFCEFDGPRTRKLLVKIFAE